MNKILNSNKAVIECINESKVILFLILFIFQWPIVNRCWWVTWRVWWPMSATTRSIIIWWVASCTWRIVRTTCTHSISHVVMWWAHVSWLHSVHWTHAHSINRRCWLCHWCWWHLSEWQWCLSAHYWWVHHWHVRLIFPCKLLLVIGSDWCKEWTLITSTASIKHWWIHYVHASTKCNWCV